MVATITAIIIIDLFLSEIILKFSVDNAPISDYLGWVVLTTLLALGPPLLSGI